VAHGRGARSTQTLSGSYLKHLSVAHGAAFQTQHLEGISLPRAGTRLNAGGYVPRQRRRAEQRFVYPRRNVQNHLAVPV